MESLFTWCAVIGGTIFTVQFVMLLIGLEGGSDLDFDAPDLDVPDLDIPDADVPEFETPTDAGVQLKDAEVDYDPHPDGFAHADGWFVGILTFRSLVAATAVFGLSGLAASKQFPPGQAMFIALACGIGTLYLVGWTFKQMLRLRSDGTVRLSDAVDCEGTVYLTIPAHNRGIGKVTIEVAGRTMEYAAMSNGPELKTGTPIVVVKLVSDSTVEVASIVASQNDTDVESLAS